QGWFLYQEALTLGYHGRVREARNLNTQAVNLAKQASLLERAASFEGGMAILDALVGNTEQARRDTRIALQIARGRDADYGPAFALALVGRSAEAERLANELEQHHPEDTPVRFKYLPSLRGLIALNRKRPDVAIDQVPAGGAYELAGTGTSFDCFYGLFYSTYVRGLAYLELHRYPEAITAFRTILDHPALVLNDPIGPFARLQLARALKGSGEKDKARAAYRELLMVWKDADPDLPIVLRVRSEVANLS
ncbi:MAG: tetratricopeptide repeat protein, partial [Bryobacteraceae bacterium]